MLLHGAKKPDNANDEDGQMASIEQTNAKKGHWQVRNQLGKVVATGLSLQEADKQLRELQQREDAA